MVASPSRVPADLRDDRIPSPRRLVLDGCRIADSELRQRENVIAAAIQKKSGRMVFNPTPGEIIGAGDVLIALGAQESLEALETRVGTKK